MEVFPDLSSVPAEGNDLRVAKGNKKIHTAQTDYEHLLERRHRLRLLLIEEVEERAEVLKELAELEHEIECGFCRVYNLAD